MPRYGLLRFARNDGWIQFRDLAALIARGLRLSLPSIETEGAGKTGCALHPRSRVHLRKKTRTRAYRSSGSIPAFPAQGKIYSPVKLYEVRIPLMRSRLTAQFLHLTRHCPSGVFNAHVRENPREHGTQTNGAKSQSTTLRELQRQAKESRSERRPTRRSLRSSANEVIAALPSSASANARVARSTVQISNRTAARVPRSR